MGVVLTLYFGLGTAFVRRTPEVQVWARDAGCPGEINGVDVVECQTGVLGPRIDPVYESGAGI